MRNESSFNMCKPNICTITFYVSVLHDIKVHISGLFLEHLLNVATLKRTGDK